MININAVCTVCNSNIPLFNIDTGNEIKIKSKIACCGVEIIISGTPKPEDVLGHLNQNQSSGYIETQKTVHKVKSLNSKKVKKSYLVSVNYIKLNDEETRIKRGILESLLKKLNVM